MLSINRTSIIRTAIMAALAMPFAAHAESGESGEATRNISDAVGPGDSNSKWVVGGYVATATDPYVGEDSKVYVFPNVEYRGEKLFVKEGKIGYNLYRNEGFSAGLLLTSESTLLSDKDEYDDNEMLVGLDKRKATLDAGLYFLHTTPMGRLRVAIVDEITGEHGGQSAGIDYTFDLKCRSVYINPVLGAVWSSADTVDHFFGVSANEAKANREYYKGHSATSFYTGVRTRYEITENWDASLVAAYVNLGSGIDDSSIVGKNDIFIAGLGVNYNF